MSSGLRIIHKSFFNTNPSWGIHQLSVCSFVVNVDEAKNRHLNVDSFLSMVRRYTDIAELTPEIVRAFVERIEVQKPEKVPGTNTRKQTIVIVWNYIGAVDIPAEQRKTAQPT